MPATENVWRSPRLMHAIFAWSAFATLATTIWMLAADFDDEWRGVQKANYGLKAAKIEDQERAIETASFEAETKDLDQKVAEAKKQRDAHQAKIAELQKQVDKLESPLALANRSVRSNRAFRDKYRADLDLKVRDGVLGKGLKPFQEKFDKQQKLVESEEIQLQELQARYDGLKAQITDLEKSYEDAKAELAKHNAALDRLEKAHANIDPSNWFKRGKRDLMQLPIIEGFNGPLKINQIWLPDLKINYGGMGDVARFDRCITCHQNIDAVETGNVPSFPHGAHGVDIHNVDAFLKSREEAKDINRKAAKGQGSPVPVPTAETFGHPFSTHPNPDLYLTAASPHPMQKFGCSGCHDGQGSGTSFQNASHSPNSPDVAEKWHKEYSYFHNHFWETPMYPKRLAEAACVKCHHNVVELGVNPKFGNSAPKLFAGYELVRKYGCFGCHEINGFNAGKPIGPDMRLEPQTDDEAARIAADPTATAGAMRKVGPGLRHFGTKATKEWAEFWVHNPQDFRKDTRMPRFFDLTNQNDKQAKRFQPVEIAAMVAYLLKKSEPMKLEKPADDYQANAERGKMLFSQRGCLACHEHDAFAGAKADFGPNLTNVHEKIKPGEDGRNWVYTWIRDPERHSPRTRMPQLFLEPEGEGEKRVDPAADIAAFLLEKGPKEYAELKWEEDALEDLVKMYLMKVLPEEQVKETLEKRIYPKDKSEIKGDEIELADGPINLESKLQYIGRRSISRYGCYGCHDIPGFEKARPIGTALQDWGRKDPSKLALEHIEEFLHHHGEPGDKSTHERVEKLIKLAENNEFRTPEERDAGTSAAYFYEQLATHGRAGFLWQKLRDPRSYDYKKTETKGYDERLRMPKFPFDEKEIEQIANFVLGLVAEPPAEKYLYRPQGPAKARIDGEKLLTKYNCVGCHIIDLPEVRYGVTNPEDLTGTELGPAEYPEGEKLLLKLKPPRDGWTRDKSKDGEKVLSFHGLIYQRPDPEDDPADQEYSYDLWETLKVGPDKVLYPGARMLVPALKLESTKPARGGAFAEWLVESLMKISPENNRSLSWQMAPPPLYQEGTKVQTSWLFNFLRNPGRIRFTTVLRMPRFNMSAEEASTLANYFAAADGSPFPYTEIDEREPGYLSAKNAEHPGYLQESWKLLNAPLCVKCHSLGGRPYQSSDPKKDIRGPNLDVVSNRLRPEWTLLWLFKPQWITPYTSMPQPFPRNQKNFPELFHGDGLTQTIAARDALMNYYLLMEQEGKISGQLTSVAPAEEAKPDDAKREENEKPRQPAEGGQ